VSLHSAYLSDRQLGVWNMLRTGVSQSEIARKLGISRQAVNQLAQTIPPKVTAALTDAATLNRVLPRYVDSSRGVLIGWSNEFRTETVITLTPKVGLRVWYKHNLGQCKICPDQKHCRGLLLDNAREFGVSLSRQEKELEPSKLSSLIFSRMLGTPQ
jgi:transcriptional regulator with XRE-family HTH domain